MHEKHTSFGKNINQQQNLGKEKLQKDIFAGEEIT